MAIAGAFALILFGPEQLPKVARKAGQLVRDVQNTSQTFIRELERAADEHETTPPAHTPASDMPPPPLAEPLPAMHHTAAPIPPPPPLHDPLAETQAVDVVAPVRQVAAPLESAGLAQHNAIVDDRDLRADIKADQAADSHAG